MGEGVIDRDEGGPEGSFPATRWTVVRQLTAGVRKVRFTAWDEFVIAYRKPLELWLLTRCRDPHVAEEMVQSFLAKMSTREHALAALDPSKGRLRSWLRVCLKRHWLDHLPRPFEALPDGYGDGDAAPDEDFDRAWARSLAARAVQELRAEYASRRRADLFDALVGVIDGATSEERAQLHEQLGMASNTFDKALERFRERLATRLRDEVAATLVEGREADVDEELRHLIGILGKSGGLRVSATDQNS